MKKLIFLASALAGLFFAASCQQENLEPVQQTETVTYSVQVPESIATKTSGDGFTLTYEVYRQNDLTKLDADPVYEGTKAFSGGKADVQLEFVKDQEFTVLFWAQQTNGAQAYDITDLREVSLETLVANDLTAEVFAGNDHVANCVSDKKGNVVLVRPVAQLNIATDADSFTLGTAGSTTATVVPTQSKVVVDGLYGTYNVANGDVATKLERTYTETAVPGTEFKSTYKLMATNYLGFIPEAGDNVKVTFYIYTQKDGTIEHTVSNVPVKANYQTNVLGNLISATADYQVTLEDWADDGKDMEVLTDGLVKNINGDYEVSSVNGLAYAINNLFVDVNGVANTATFYVKPDEYDMAQQAINDITVTSGTLKVYDTEAVVTRSETTGSVVIKGLKKALIQKVEEDATVFFSGITITDFNGADDAAALVQTNKGKVVLADCDIVNGEGEDTELVLGNDPVEVEKGEEEAGDLIYTAEQLAAAFADETVQKMALGADIALKNTLVFPAGRTATLDLRGWELTISEPENVATTYAINNLGTLTIKDSYATGEVKSRGIYNGYVEGNPNSEAKLTIESGTFNAMGTNGGAAIYNYGIVEINCGTFNSNGGYALNNRAGASMSLEEANVRGGIYNCGTVAITASQVYQHISGRHAIYNLAGSVTINSGDYDSESGNELIFADGENASVTINNGEFHKTAKSWLYAAATGKDISFVINGGTHYGYVNEPEMTVDTFRPYGDKFVVTGGSYNFDVTKWCAKDYKAVKNAETTMWDVVEKVYVANIGEDGYESLQEAFNAGGEIYLVSDVKLTEMAVLESEKTATLDLNGFAITVPEAVDGKSIYALNNKGTLTIKDSKGNGSISARGIYNGYNGVSTDETVEGAKLTVESGTFYALNSDGGACIFNSAELIIKGGLFDGQVAAVNARKCANTTINGGTFRSVSNYAIQQNNGGNMTIETASVDRGFGAVGCFGGTVTINGGTYLPTAQAGKTCHVVYVASAATVSIQDGTFKMNYPENALPDSGSAVASYYSGKLSIGGGTFYAHFDTVSPVELSSGSTITGGTFYNHSGEASSHSYITNFIADGYVLKNGTVEKFVPAAKVGNTEYGSIDEAIANWTNNSTLTLLADVTLSDVVTLKSTEHHILDLSTFTITAASSKNAFVIKACGTGDAERTAITIKASAENPGGINAGQKSIIYYKYADGGISGNDRPIIKIEGGVFTGSTSTWGTAGIYTIGTEARKCATLNISGGTFNCTINGSTKSKLLISGGTFNYSVGSQGDSTALRLIWGGKFKTLGFMTADDNNTKFWFGTSMGNSNVGLYIDDEGYLVVGGPVITDFGSQFAAKANNATKWNSLLQYSSASTNGLYYTNADAAIKKHGQANVVLK